MFRCVSLLPPLPTILFFITSWNTSFCIDDHNRIMVLSFGAFGCRSSTALTASRVSWIVRSKLGSRLSWIILAMSSVISEIVFRSIFVICAASAALILCFCPVDFIGSILTENDKLVA